MSILSFIKGKTKQDFVYWSPSGNNGFGKMEFEDPVELKGRWEDEFENMAKDSSSRIKVAKDGKEYLSQATIFTSEKPVDGWHLDGYVFLGVLTDLATPADPYSNNKAFEIKRIDSIPDLNNTGTMFRIHL